MSILDLNTIFKVETHRYAFWGFVCMIYIVSKFNWYFNINFMILKHKCKRMPLDQTLEIILIVLIVFIVFTSYIVIAITLKRNDLFY